MVRTVALAIAIFAGCLCLANLSTAFVSQTALGNKPSLRASTLAVDVNQPTVELEPLEAPQAAWSSVHTLLGGFCLGLALLFASPQAAKADAIEDVQIKADTKGTTVTLTKEQLGRGKRLFLSACSNCHVGGISKPNPNVGLEMEALAGALPARDNIAGLVDYLNNPTTYDGLKDLSETHPCMSAADLWPKMRAMKQKDLVDISSYILYMGNVISERWGGGKIYY